MFNASPKPTFYGWRMVWALALTQTIGYGVLYYAFSVFLAPMEADLGWSRSATSGGFSLALLLSGLAAVPIGRWVDRHGARTVMSLGSAAGALLVLAWAHVDSLAVFYLIQAGIGLVMAAVLYDVAFTVVAVWFRRARARAMLAVTLVAGLASTIFIPLATLLIGLTSWRDALTVLAVILGVGTIPLHALVLRRHPRDLGLEPDGVASSVSAGRAEPDVTARDALRAPTFWWLSAAFALSRIAVVAVGAHLVPILAERGHSPGLVAAAAGSIGLMQLAGRLVFTPMGGRVPLIGLTAATFAVHAVAFLTLLVLPGALGLWAFAVLFGFGNGAITLARAALVADIYGTGHYGSISGSIALIIALLQTVAPLGAGLLHDASGGYVVLLWSLAAISSLAALAVTRSGVARGRAHAG